MFRIQTLNQIALTGLERFPRDRYEVASELGQPDAILLRSHKLDTSGVPGSVKAIARAGAGVNNIAVSAFTELGIPVFNTPGANANAVKELVLAALLLSSRGLIEGIEWVQGQGYLDAGSLHSLVEKEKKNFAGNEIAGKTLGVIGLGAIGLRVAQMALDLGMSVLGFDPALSVDAAWRLPSRVQRMETLGALMSRSDYVTLHLPLLESTRHILNKDLIAAARPGLRLINFAREGVVDDDAALEGLQDGRIATYISDFPTPALIGVKGVIATPHLGASTAESEENCAVMAANQLMDFLENGNVVNSVNYPTLVLERSGGYRLAVSNRNVPRMLGNILSVLADRNINVLDMLNRSRDEIAYNLLDLDVMPEEQTLANIRAIDGVINVRMLCSMTP